MWRARGIWRKGHPFSPERGQRKAGSLRSKPEEEESKMPETSFLVAGVWLQVAGLSLKSPPFPWPEPWVS